MRSTIQSLSDADLLGVLVGSRTAAHLLKDASGSLAQLLHEPVPAVYAQPRAASKLQAARELVRRSLAEQMQPRDVLASPRPCATTCAWPWPVWSTRSSWPCSSMRRTA